MAYSLFSPDGYFYALLEVDLKSLKKRQADLFLLMFLIGDYGTMIGVVVSWFVVQTPARR